jgi:hypothetical protein
LLWWSHESGREKRYIGGAVRAAYIYVGAEFKAELQLHIT